MCELLGVSCNKEVRANISFKALQGRAEKNPDGWGFAFYPDESAQIFKEPFEANQSDLADFVARYDNIRSRIFLCHIRKWNTESRAHRNTHPFSRELNGKDYVFAHNGTIPKLFKLSRFQPLGITDSERFFCHLMDFIAKNALDFQDGADLSLLEDHLRDINRPAGTTLNCLFSDGEHLCCYTDVRGYKRLHFLQRKPGYLAEIQNYEDDELSFKFNVQKGQDEQACIVATKPLTDENWSILSRGSLRVLRDGQVIYPEPMEFEENRGIEAEVYESPRWANGLADFPNVIGMPKSLRQALVVELDNKVKVTCNEQIIELIVCKSAGKLVQENSASAADNRERHVWLPSKIRNDLDLVETAIRNGCPKFKTKYTSVGIQRID